MHYTLTQNCEFMQFSEKSQNCEFIVYHAILRKKSELRDVNLQLEEKSLNCEIKTSNYLFYFLFSGKKRASILLYIIDIW